MYEAPEIIALGKVKKVTLGPRGGQYPDGGEDLWFRWIWPLPF